MNLEQAKYDPIDLHVLHSHLAGLLFDFMGWLTTRKERLTHCFYCVFCNKRS
jgi:hypothetical protein